MVARLGGYFSLLSVISAVELTVDISEVKAKLPAEFLGFGQEMKGFLNGVEEGKWSDPRVRKLVSHLRPFKLRVGGITGDWVHYNGFANNSMPSGLSASYWPTKEFSFSTTNWAELKQFAQATGAKVVFQLDELHGRDCTLPQEWCQGTWNTSNLAEFLRAIKQDYVSGDWLVGLELGNELTNPRWQRQHLTVQETIDDMVALKALGDGIFHEMPTYVAPSTDYCSGGQPEQYLKGVAGTLSAFSFHSYPGCGYAKSAAPGLLLNLTWLRTGLIENDAHADVGSCVSAASKFGVKGLLTETQSTCIWENCTGRDPTEVPCHVRTFNNGFWYIASLGQFALAGVELHARWTLSEEVGSPFSTIFWDYDGSISIATDYWVAVLHKRLMGSKVLNAALSDQNVGLVYASCSAHIEGAVTVMYANPSASAIMLTPPEGWTWHQHYVFTGEGVTIRLNGEDLKIMDDGELPDIKPVAKGGDVQLPPLSYGFFVFPQASAVVCGGSTFHV